MFEEVLSRIRPRIIEHELPHNLWGAYDLATNTILLRPRLAPIQRKSTLHHETAHAYFQHTGHHPRQERQAEELAATWLIRPDAFTTASKMFNTATSLAAELEVLPRDIRAYMRFLQRTQKQETPTWLQDA